MRQAARPVLIVMLRVPRPGQVKTRLAAAIGAVAAAAWYRHQCRSLLRRLRDPRWDLRLAVSPDAEGRTSRCWPARLLRRPQGRGDIGARMLRALRSTRHGPAILIGSDIPGLRAHHIARAFQALRGADLVFGPATDGGFWLVGARHPRRLTPALFAGVRWSAPETLADVLARAQGQRIALAGRMQDVDVAADLARRCGPTAPG